MPERGDSDRKNSAFQRGVEDLNSYLGNPTPIMNAAKEILRIGASGNDDFDYRRKFMISYLKKIDEVEFSKAIQQIFRNIGDDEHEKAAMLKHIRRVVAQRYFGFPRDMASVALNMIHRLKSLFPDWKSDEEIKNSVYFLRNNTAATSSVVLGTSAADLPVYLQAAGDTSTSMPLHELVSRKAICVMLAGSRT